jgi:hypothetical protein
MAKATTEIFGVIKIIVLLVVGVFVFMYVRTVYAKTKDEKASDAEFKKEGAFASVGRFLFGDDTFADTGTPDTTQKEQEQKNQKALQESSDLIDKALEQKKKDDEIRKEAERQADKVINKDPTKDPASAVDEREKVIREQKAKEETAKKKDTTFDRTKEDFRIFRFSTPIETTKGKVVDFAIKVIDPKKPDPKAAKILRDEATKQAKEAGFTPKEPLITGLSQKTLDRIAKDPKLQRQIEQSQLRRLGLR